MESALVLTGIGLRPPHYAAFLESRPRVAWIEVHSENYFGENSRSLQVLEQLRHDYPISYHGVGLSIGSADDLNWNHLRQLRDLINRVNPCLVSDHLSWSSINGRYLHDLLPLPYTEEALAHVVSRIQQVQEYLGRQILIENISSYVHHEQSTLTEWDFLRLVAEQSGCGILLDVNNVYVSSVNLGFSPETYLAAIPKQLVQEVHLAGFSTTTIDGKDVLIDTHNRPVAPKVWDLYRRMVQMMGTKPTIIEWDSDLPALPALLAEARIAEQTMREVYVAAKLSA